MKTFKDHATEAQMSEADRIAHAATWDAAIEAAAEHIERLNESVGDAAAYDNRDMYCCENERGRTAQACADAVRALATE